ATRWSAPIRARATELAGTKRQEKLSVNALLSYLHGPSILSLWGRKITYGRNSRLLHSMNANAGFANAFKRLVLKGQKICRVIISPRRIAHQGFDRFPTSVTSGSVLFRFRPRFRARPRPCRSDSLWFPGPPAKEGSPWESPFQLTTHCPNRMRGGRRQGALNGNA